MFTLEQLDAAHSKVKTGADFPRYVQDIKNLGLVYYEFLVRNGQTVYYGENNYIVEAAALYDDKTISGKSSAADVRQIIADHQQGKSDFFTFCTQVADAGVEKWVVDTRILLCSYYDLAGNCLVAEPIPEVSE